MILFFFLLLMLAMAWGLADHFQSIVRQAPPPAPPPIKDRRTGAADAHAARSQWFSGRGRDDGRRAAERPADQHKLSSRRHPSAATGDAGAAGHQVPPKTPDRPTVLPDRADKQNSLGARTVPSFSAWRPLAICASAFSGRGRSCGEIG